MDMDIYRQLIFLFPKAMCMVPQYIDGILGAGAEAAWLIFGRVLGGWGHAKRQTLSARVAREQQPPH